jgi:hypothetical protein
MNRLSSSAAFAAATLLGASVCAQDSVSINPCLPGDAVSPWSPGEQRNNRYVVDLVPITTSWNNQFGIAPLIKSSKGSTTFFNSVINAQGISRTQRSNITIPGSYSLWTTAGGGVNDDPAINQPGTPISNIPNGNQFGVAFAEFGTSDLSIGYDNIITGVVRWVPHDPRRLYVERFVTASSGCDNTSQLATFGFGAVDDLGRTIFRSDSFGVSGSSSCASTTPVVGNNVYLVDADLRTPLMLNVISGGYPVGFDAGVTNWLIQASSVSHNAPNLATNGLYVGTNFTQQYVRGLTSGSIVSDTTHLAAGVTDHRGTLGYLTQNHAALASVRGICSVLGVATGGVTAMNVFGLNAAGNPTTRIALAPPAVVTDPITGETNIPGGNQFDHYHSQTAFRGGASQIAMNVDPAGNLLVTAVMNHPTQSAPAPLPPFSHEKHFLPVARVTPAGAVSWTNAAYNTSASGNAKALLNGPGGAAIGRLSTLAAVTGGTPNGPSFSAPMIDSGGNIWFLSAVEIFGTPSRFTTGLVRAVYDQTRFGYELELVFANGTVVHGANSNTNWQIQFMPLADSDSVSSSTAWSQNISEEGHNGQKHPAQPSQSPLHLGGLVINANIVYDNDGNGMFDDCIGNPASGDQEYGVALYLGALTDCQLDLGFQGPGGSQLSVCGTGLNTGESSTVSLTNAPASAPTAILANFAGFPNIPIFGGTLVSFGGNFLAVSATTSAQGRISFPLAGAGVVVDVVIQMVSFDPSLPGLFAFSNAVLARFGR